MLPGVSVFRNGDLHSEGAGDWNHLPEIGAVTVHVVIVVIVVVVVPVPTEADRFVLEAGAGDCGREAARHSARHDHEVGGRGGDRGGDLDDQNGQDQGEGRYTGCYPSPTRYSRHACLQRRDLPRPYPYPWHFRRRLGISVSVRRSAPGGTLLLPRRRGESACRREGPATG
jgi:hypothetical protein